ncbi:MAG: aldehyde dehydrogenase family protein, partial [Leptonema sp. (in: Bacteria)]|nr:aldehyde dehydrogenase family protein [Leptonema sp. (in: bacteria)]
KIAEICAKMLKPVILELGGNDPMVVLDDANLKRAAQAALWGGMSNSGQTCISVERVIIDEKVKDKFIDLLKEYSKNIKQGLQAENPSIGAMAFEKQLGIVLDQLDDARQRGTTILIGGNRNMNYPKGTFIEPTIVVDPASDSKVWRDETFGPVVAIRTFKTEAEAIDIANDTVYGLNGSVWSRSKKRARKIARQIRSGTLCINDVMTNYILSDVPFGGQKESGIGRVYGKEGFRSFCDMQSVMEDRFGMSKELWWFPYSIKVENLFKTVTRLLFG